MLTLRRRISREDVSVFSSGDRPVLLATLDVPVDPEASRVSVDAAVEAGTALVGPDRALLSRRLCRKAAKTLRERAPCLVWLD